MTVHPRRRARVQPALDLAALTFIDSSGLAVLIEAAQQASPLLLRNTSDTVRRVIAATGLTELFGVP